MTHRWYEQRYRRALLDMHIPDWDPRFLARYDPARLVELYARSGVNAAMVYANSHVGLCLWPTRVGRPHATLRGRDVLGETLALLRERGIAATVYYSVIYNNSAALEHPEWRLVADPAPAGGFPGPRYGMCCPNAPGYREFACAQVDELVEYAPDGIFFDMTFAFPPCRCPHCVERLGSEPPQRVDWLSPEWCEYQRLRESWSLEFAELLTERARPLTVQHNFISPRDWVLASPLAGAGACDFLSGDFHEGIGAQLVVSRLFAGLSATRPPEFMTALATSVLEHVSLKPPEELELAACAALAAGCAITFIDAVDPDGTVNEAAYAPVRAAFERIAPFEPYAGGEPVADVALYFSGDSRMDFAENGRLVADCPGGGLDYPHFQAIAGAARKLQAAHVPFTIVTRRQLAELGRYRVLCLPNVLRMDAEEAAAFRAYVAGGGRLYASRLTSLTETRGVRHDDFMLADVFGCSFGREEPSVPAGPTFAGFHARYLRPLDEDLIAAIAPQRHLSHHAAAGDRAGVVRLRAAARGEALAMLSLPYADEWGAWRDREWSSIHSSPPWREDVAPAIVRHRFGDGVAIYAAADLETVDHEAHARVFTSLVRSLLGPEPSYAAATAPSVLVAVADQQPRQRLVATALNVEGAAVGPLSLELAHARSRRFVRAAQATLAGAREIPAVVTADGRLRIELEVHERLAVICLDYEDDGYGEHQPIA